MVIVWEEEVVVCFKVLFHHEIWSWIVVDYLFVYSRLPIISGGLEIFP